MDTHLKGHKSEDLRALEVILSGPTASGKSSLALLLAKELPFEIINCDSVQMYRGLDIGSAKVSRCDQKTVPHHLIDVFSPAERGDVAAFLRLSGAALASIEERGRRPLFVGGGGLYVQALLSGLIPAPRASEQAREELAQISTPNLYARLQERDPERAALISCNDRVRILRALEIALVSGRSATALYQENAHSGLLQNPVFLVLCWPRDQLYARIDARSQEMIDHGLLEETKCLRDEYGDQFAMQNVIGYREALACLQGQITTDQVSNAISQATRRFAKRQMTFWRNFASKNNLHSLPADGELEVVQTGAEGNGSAREKRKGFHTYTWTLKRLRKELENPRTSTVYFLSAPHLFRDVRQISMAADEPQRRAPLTRS